MRSAALLLLAVSLCTGAAHAAAPAPSHEARQRFEEGVLALQEGRAADAVALLTRALSLTPRASTAFNLALAKRGTGDVLGAIELLERLQRREFGALSRAESRQTEQLLRQAREEVASLSLRVQEPAREVVLYLDGVRVALKEGAAQRALNPGEHHVVVRALDYEPVEQSFVLGRGESKSLQFALNPAKDTRPGVLRLESKESRATLHIEGVASGPSPLARELPPGDYRVAVTLGDARRESSITLPPGRSVRLVLDNPQEGHSVLSKPWFWLGIGAFAAVTTGVVLWATIEVQEPPSPASPVWGRVSALEF